MLLDIVPPDAASPSLLMIVAGVVACGALAVLCLRQVAVTRRRPS